MPTLHDATARDAMLARFAALPADRAPRWGTMTAPRMLAHVTDAMRMALGDLPIAPRRMILRYPPFKQLMIHLVPMPKNLPTADELKSRTPRGMAEELADLRALFARFGAKGASAAWVPHPVFGAMSGRAWGVLSWRHLDHHLRQFDA